MLETKIFKCLVAQLGTHGLLNFKLKFATNLLEIMTSEKYDVIKFNQYRITIS